MNARNGFCVFWCSTIWYLVYLIWENGDFFLSGLSTYWFICLYFSWLLFKPTSPKQACSSFTLHSIFPETELFQCSGEQKLCAVFHGTVVHLRKLREDTFLLYIGQSTLYYSQLWNGRGKNCVLLPLLSVRGAAGPSGGVLRAAAEGSPWASLACRTLGWKTAVVAKAAFSF